MNKTHHQIQKTTPNYTTKNTTHFNYPQNQKTFELSKILKGKETYPLAKKIKVNGKVDDLETKQSFLLLRFP